MFLTKLSFKNLVRHRNRTIITVGIIAMAVFSYILIDSLIGGMTEMSYNSIINYETGHLQIVNKKYWTKKEKLPLENLINFDQSIRPTIKNIKGYQASTVELDFQARLNNGVNEFPVVGKGINPVSFLKTFSLENKFVAGKMFASGEYKAVMGKKLADLLKLKPGDYITLLVKDRNETYNTLDMEISGLVQTVNPNVNNNIVYLPLNLVQKALNVDNQVSKVLIRLSDKNLAIDDAEDVENKLKNMGLKNLEVYAWNQLNSVSMQAAVQAENQILLSIILLIAAIAIINMVILAALERIKEIGMMKALGLRVKETIYIFVLESTAIGILGSIIGVIIGAAGVWLLSHYGIDFGAMTGVDNSVFGIPMIGRFYGVWHPGAFLMVFSFGVLGSLLASILPAYWASRKDPIDSIQHR